MKNRIEILFQQKKKDILSIYFTAGFPALNDTAKIILYLEEAGADLVEVGFPFSDPLADGPVIQRSSQQAIANGMSLKILFEQLKNIRIHTQIPLILMGYLNPVLQFGEENFINQCKETGIDGLILPDMPLDYFESHLKDKLHANGICSILLITPETSVERIRKIDALSGGFIYMVSSNSITGGERNMDLQKGYFLKIEKMDLKNQRLIGFGVRNKESFEDACRYSSGAIIGTAFIEHLNQFGTSKESIHKFIRSIKS